MVMLEYSHKYTVKYAKKREKKFKKAYEYSLSEANIREVCSDNDYYFNNRGELMNVKVAKIW